MNRVKHRATFEGRLRRKYGLSVEEFAWLWHGQGGRCPICTLPLDLDRPAQCNVDHEHGPKRKKKKPKVRGLLHGFCNYRYLGHVERGGPTRYRNAGTYLGWTVPLGSFFSAARGHEPMDLVRTAAI